MLTFEELKWILNENCIICLYNANQDLIGYYNSHNSIEEFFDDCIVNDIFTNKFNEIPAIGIEIDYDPIDNLENEIDH